MIFSPLMSAVPGVVHCFTDDQGPWSPDPEHNRAFWSGIATPLGFSGPQTARLNQVHGIEVIEAREGGDLGIGDALISRTPGVLLSIRTADCVPILMASENEVAAIHAGWRGLVAGIIEATVECFQRPILAAAVGPCIGVHRYEVGPELVDALSGCGVPESVFLRADIGPKPHINLRQSAAWKLSQFGIDAEVSPVCTWEDERFPSYRRNGPLSGRMASLIGLQ